MRSQRTSTSTRRNMELIQKETAQHPSHRRTRTANHILSHRTTPVTGLRLPASPYHARYATLQCRYYAGSKSHTSCGGVARRWPYAAPAARSSAISPYGRSAPTSNTSLSRTGAQQPHNSSRYPCRLSNGTLGSHHNFIRYDSTNCRGYNSDGQILHPDAGTHSRSPMLH